MEKTMTIRGVGNVRMRPDMVEVHITLEAARMVYAEAMAAANEQIESLRRAVTGAGFAAEDLKTTDFSVHTKQKNVRDGEGNYTSVFDGYVCRHALRLAFAFDTQKLGEALDAISGTEAAPQIRLEFTVRDREAAMAELLESAVASAKKKAKTLARASGVHLGDLVHVDYNWNELDIQSVTRYCADGAAARSMEIVPDDVQVCDAVTLTWELKSGK